MPDLLTIAVLVCTSGLAGFVAGWIVAPFAWRWLR